VGAAPFCVLGFQMGGLLLHAERDAAALEVDLGHSHLDMLMQLDDFVWISDEAVGKLRHMNQAVLMNADVDEAPELRDVRHDARQEHAHLQVANLFHSAVELEHFSLASRVAPRFFQLVHDVGQGRDAYFGRDIAFQVDSLLPLFVLDQFGQGASGVLRHLFNQGVAFWMNGRVV